METLTLTLIRYNPGGCDRSKIIFIPQEAPFLPFNDVNFKINEEE